MEMTWVDFYTKFAVKLLEYKNQRNILISKLKSAFINAGVNLPTIEENDNNITDIDPFTIFAFFNRQITEVKRNDIISSLNTEFAVDATLPSDYIGIPVVNNMMTAFFPFAFERKENDINNLWNFFEVALNYVKNPKLKDEFIRLYDTCESQKCVKWNLTMGLFWINPYFYVSLDSRMRWYLSLDKYFDEHLIKFMKNHHSSDKASHVPSGKEYLEIREELIKYISGDDDYHSIIELSAKAWVVSEEDNKAEKERLKEESLEERGVHTWIYSPGDNADHFKEFYDKEIIGIDYAKLENPNQYDSKEKLQNALKEAYGDESSHSNKALAIWQFIHEMEVGDVVFAKKGLYEIVGRGIVESDYIYDINRKDYKNVRKIKWTHEGSWKLTFQAAQKTLTDITDYTDRVNELNSLINNDSNEEIEIEDNVKYEEYSKTNFLSEVFIDDTDYERLVSLLLMKKNIIIQGAPGVGKSFAAKRLAYSIMGKKAVDRVEVVQFHQSYAYEDFIMGYRPNSEGFNLEKGTFYNFCKKAELDSENKYFFIIDEINRGNLNKIFGELFLLIEADKRDTTKVRLLYSNELFSIPSNVYIIGMMNTADRSLAMMDYALRRRFAFFTMNPAFDNSKFIDYLDSINNEKLNKLIDNIKTLNGEITRDESLGKGFAVGHSYFCGLNKEPLTDQIISNIIEYEMIPLIEEYWYDDQAKVNEWSNKLRGILK